MYLFDDCLVHQLVYLSVDLVHQVLGGCHLRLLLGGLVLVVQDLFAELLNFVLQLLKENSYLIDGGIFEEVLVLTELLPVLVLDSLDEVVAESAVGDVLPYFVELDTVVGQVLLIQKLANARFDFGGDSFLGEGQVFQLFVQLIV